MPTQTDRHLHLIGFMGTGKSAVARALGPILNRDVIDLDEEIAATAGMSIADIFERHGEDDFRRRETQALLEAIKLTPAVIALGGGVLIREENRQLIRDSGEAVLLTATWETIWARLEESDDRPLLNNIAGTGSPNDDTARYLRFVERASALFDSRAEQYAQAAACTIDTTSFTAKQTAQAIADWWHIGPRSSTPN